MSAEPELGQARRRILDIGLIRVAINAVVLLGTYIGLQLAVAAVAHGAPKPEHDLVVLAGFAALSIVMLGVYAVLVRIVERRGASEVVIAPGLAIGGVILGAALFCGVYATLWWLGVARWEGLSSDAALTLPLAIAIGAAVGEELTFRGGIFRVLEDSFGTLVAVVFSAIAFGLLHALNPGATIVSTAAIALEAGVFLGLGYAATRNLWFPIGLHFGWNFTEGGIFNAAVSGRAYHGLIHVSLSGPERLTGGTFGPEASAVAVGISLAVSLVFAIIALRNGRWKPLSLRMRLSD
jgi:membrane protease YdiL (CAAX protease family)